MKTSLSTLTRNILNATQVIAEAYLRRAGLRYQNADDATKHRRSFYFRRFRSDRGFWKYKR